MGAWTEIVDFTFTANETSRAFTGLNITKDDFIKVVLTATHGLQTTDYSLFPNTAAGVSGFDTNSNYHEQTLIGAGSSIFAGRSALNRISVVGNTATGTSITYLKLSENGKYNSFTNYTVTHDSGIQTIFDYTTSSNLTFNDPITSLTLTASRTDGIGTGSRIQIYRLDAEKVADITTTANATQVDISSLSIGKDSEYLLVSDVDNIVNDTSYSLAVNDNTTLTNYYAQLIAGNGSTASAERQNLPRLFYNGSTGKHLNYTHIKLSEIGAYTAQTYGIRDYGTTTPIVYNFFVSSTAENITSITKLNFIASRSNALGSGSRFILYKLK
jgi:hypothetical protein